MEDGHFRIALLARLGIPLPLLSSVTTCGCGRALGEDALGHILRCSRGSERTAAHDAIRDCVADILAQGGFQAQREVLGLLPGQRRVDVVGTDLSTGERILGDVTIANPQGSSEVNRAAVTPGYAASQAEVEKRRSYEEYQGAGTFFPLAVETFGCLGRGFDALLRQCAQGAACMLSGQVGRSEGAAAGDDRVTGSFLGDRLLAYFRGRIAVVLQRAQAVAIIARSCRVYRGSVQVLSHRVSDIDLVTAVGLRPAALVM
jgi:hypothetical protein